MAEIQRRKNLDRHHRRDSRGQQCTGYGAQIFEAIGLDRSLVERYFTGTSSRIEGVNMEVLAREAIMKHEFAMQPPSDTDTELRVGGEYQYRVRGEKHLINPLTVSKLQQAVRQSKLESFQEFADIVNQQNRDFQMLRGMFEFKPASDPIPLDDVEPASEIVKRFATGAMSFGSISKEAHETLAIAMNRIGGKSNTGEGGEDEARFSRRERRSAAKRDQAGGFGALRRHDELPRERGRPADQDRAGREARRRRPAARATRWTRSSRACATRFPAWA